MKKSLTPRRRDPEKTKATILKTAQATFAEMGYVQATVREIATRAGITSPMLLHYFGSKLGLYEAALYDAIDMGFLDGADRANFGKTYASLISDPVLTNTASRRPGLGGMIVLSIGDPDARAVAQAALEKRAVRALSIWLGSPDAKARAVQITMLTIAYGLVVHQIPIAPRRSTTHDKLIVWFAETVQQIVDGD